MTLKTIMYPAVVGDRKTILAAPFDPTKDTEIKVNDLSVFPDAPNRVVIQKASKEHLITYIYTAKSGESGAGTLTIGDPTKYTEIDIPESAKTIYPLESYVWRPYCQADDQAERENITENANRIDELEKQTPIHIKSDKELEEGLQKGGNFILDNDLNLNKTITVPAGTKSILNMNGKYISTLHEGYRCFMVQGKLTIYDPVGTSYISKFSTKNDDNGGFAYVGDANESELIISGITIKETRAESVGGAIFLAFGATLELHNVTIQDTYAASCGAICQYAESGTMLLDNCRICNTSAKDYSSAISVKAKAVIKNTLIQHVSTEHNGGAINVTSKTGELDMQNCIIQHAAARNGSVLNADTNCTVTISKSFIQDSKATDGAIITASENAAITLTDTTIEDTTGAVINIEDSTAATIANVSLQGVTISNTTSDNTHPPIYVGVLTYITLIDTTIQDTHADTAAVYLAQESVALVSGNTRIIDNPKNIYMHDTAELTIEKPLTNQISIYDPDPSHKIGTQIGEGVAATTEGLENIRRDNHAYYQAEIIPEMKLIRWGYRAITYDELDTLLQTNQPDPVKLLSDLTADHEIYIPPNTTNTLDLYGHTITSQGNEHRFLTIENPTSFTLTSTLDGEGSGNITNFASDHAGGAISITSTIASQITIDNIHITQCIAPSGGGLFINTTAGTKLTLHKVEIVGCGATQTNGGGINFMGGELNLDTAIVRECTAILEGAGIYSYGNTITMKGECHIDKNRTHSKTALCSGMYINPLYKENPANLIIAGGHICIRDNRCFQLQQNYSDLILPTDSTLQFTGETTGDIRIKYAGANPAEGLKFAVIADGIKTTCSCRTEPDVTNLVAAINGKTLVWELKKTGTTVTPESHPNKRPINPIKPNIPIIRKNIKNMLMML